MQYRQVLVLILLPFIGILCEKMDTPVSISCINCIAHASSAQNFNKTCTDSCGVFRVSKDYWIEAGMPMVNRIPNSHPKAFEKCANSPICGYHLVQLYMQKFKKDCNGDGVVDCDDFVRIHKLGADKCHEELPEHYLDRFEYCKEVVPL
uniref:lysozyme n=1 Tax=Photinus pyralis TaxID=7054 RepID=A0A1Y1MF21_PHOPY